MLMIDVFPAPEGPKIAVIPESPEGNATSTVNTPNFFRTFTSSTAQPRTLLKIYLELNSDNIRATNATTTEITHNRKAPASPSGDLGQGIESKRQGPGLAGNVGDKSYGSSKFAETTSESQNDPCNDTGHNERHGNGKEYTKRSGP